MAAEGPPGKAEEQLAELYREIDAALARLETDCRACGACCHFDEADHVLYATRLEFDYFLKQSAACGIEQTEARPGRCPYQSEGRCMARQMRPLGCRLHFCRSHGSDTLSPEDAAALERLSASAHARLREIHETAGLRWEYRPFLVPCQP